MKKLVSFCLITFVLLMICLFMNNSKAAFSIGDVNGDGKVSSHDYIVVRKNIIGVKKLTDEQKARADINLDGKVSSHDYILIKKIILNQIDAPTFTPVPNAPTSTPSPNLPTQTPFPSTPAYTPTPSKTKYELKYATKTLTKLAGVRPFKNTLTNTGPNNNITYTSSNKKVAVVEKDGTVKILGVGETIITAKVNDNSYNVKETSYKLITTFNNIAYSQINGSDKTINSQEHLKYVVKLKAYDSIKVDVQPTKDGGIILCHDPGFTLKGCDAKLVGNTVKGDLSKCRIGKFNKNSNIPIIYLTTAQTQKLLYENGDHVATFDYYVDIMNKNPSKMAFITVRGNIITKYSDTSKYKMYVDKVLASMSDELKNRTIINALAGSGGSGTWSNATGSDALKEFRKRDSNIMLSLVVSDDDNNNISLSYAKRTNDGTYNYGYYILSLYIFRSDQSETRRKILKNNFGNLKDVIGTAREYEIPVFTGCMSNKNLVVPNDYLINHGFSGIQIDALLN